MRELRHALLGHQPENAPRGRRRRYLRARHIAGGRELRPAAASRFAADAGRTAAKERRDGELGAGGGRPTGGRNTAARTSVGRFPFRGCARDPPIASIGVPATRSNPRALSRAFVLDSTQRINRLNVRRAAVMPKSLAGRRSRNMTGRHLRWRQTQTWPIKPTGPSPPSCSWRSGQVPFDLAVLPDRVVAIRVEVAEDAFTASILGTERTGNGVVMNDDGLVLDDRLPDHRSRNDLADDACGHGRSRSRACLRSGDRTRARPAAWQARPASAAAHGPRIGRSRRRRLRHRPRRPRACVTRARVRAA